MPGDAVIIPLSGAQTLHPNNDINKDVPQIEYSEEEKKYITFRRQRMIAARDQRDMARPEFDDMGFLKYMEMLKKADDQYLAPRKNKQDTSINTGTIRDKDTTLVEYAMKYDFEPVAQVYDDNNDMLQELAETGEDLVRKSMLLEDFKSKAKLIYRSMVAFGTAMVEEAYVERWTIEKQFGKGARIGSEGTTWTERMVKTYDGCQTKLWDLRKIYFGDIRKFFLNGPQGQPFLFTVEYESYDVVKQIYGDWERFKYVPKVVIQTAELANASTWSSWWSIQGPVTLDSVEIVRGYDPIANEYYITLNGIDMLPLMKKKVTARDGSEQTLISGFPLTAVSPSGAIPFSKFDLEPMHDFVYSKSQPGKMRVWQDVENMIIKLFIGAFKQKVKPTMGNKSGRLFDDTVTDPATVINDIREGDLFPILPNFQGVQPGDFSFYELIKKNLDQNSVERSFQGSDSPTPQDETATKEMNDMKAQSLKVGALFDGIVWGHRQLFWLRIWNITANWTKPIDVQIDVFRDQATKQDTTKISNKYRTVTLPSEVDGGQKATKKIVFTKDTARGGKSKLERSQNVHQEELDYTKENGMQIRTAYLHPEQLASMKLLWSFDAVPVPNGNDPLSYVLFAKQITDAQTFFGPDSLNVKKLKHKFAAKTGEDFDTWFINEQELQQKQQAAAASQPNPGDPNANKMPGGTPPGGPSIQSAIQGRKPVMAMK